MCEMMNVSGRYYRRWL